MAGDPPSHAADRPPEHPTPRVKTFSCPSCGASVSVQYPGASLSAVCDSCHSVIDVTNSNYAILSTYARATGTYQPVIPLGTRGKLAGRTWEVIGFMVRRDNDYFWEEYLLFNPYYGYRWLVRADNHWSFVQMIKKKPRQTKRTSAIASLDGKNFRLFNRGTGEVVYVIGEFYWKVIVASTVEMEDYINPPLMLSREKSDNDIVWSVGTYTEPKVIQEAFKLDKVAHPRGVAPNQPSKDTNSWNSIKKQWLAFVVFLTLAQMFFAVTASNSKAASGTFSYTPNTKVSDLSSGKFTLVKSLANAKIQITSPVDNSWLWVSGDLVNNADGTTFPFEQTAEYYHGSDSDGAWTEGDQSCEQTISAVPGGDYYLNFDIESGDYKDTTPRSFTVTVWRDVPNFGNYFLCLFFLFFSAMIAWMKMRQVEVARWSNSDYSPYVSPS